jgi:D-beta-D-heptose 7-phosphate kinase/D-beta-D-heptose 1-phosphate adenosyltransferase
MAALECVDFVTWFTEETPRDLICRLQPAIIVKGGDYDAAQVVGAQEAKAWGGRVKIVPLVEGHSTTGIINRTANPAG